MSERMTRSRYLAMALLATPWLIPPQVEPSPALVPWLVTLVCVSLLLLMLQANPRGRINGQPQGDVAAGAWLLAATASTAIALCQYLEIEQFFFWMSRADAGQVYGNLRQRNQYASLTMIGLLATLWWAGRGPADRRRRAWIGLSAAFLAAGNAASGSRTGLVEMVLVSGFVLLWTTRPRADLKSVLLPAWLVYALTAILVGLRAGGGAAAGGILARALEQGEPCASRTVMWQNMLELIRQRPWSGWGWGELDYAHFMTAYPGMRQCELIDNAHNLLLHFAVELGLPLTMLVCGIGIYGVWRGRPWRESDPTRQMAWGVLGLLMLHSMVEYPLWYGPFLMSALVSLALLLRPLAPRRGLPARRPAPRWHGAAALLVLVGVAYASWDYFRLSQIYRMPDQRAAAYRERTLEKIRDSWLFRDSVRFAEFTLTPLSPGNAAQLHAMGLALLHHSPEPRVVEKLIESAVMLGRDEEAQFYLGRYRAAYPKEHARWTASTAASAALKP